MPPDLWSLYACMKKSRRFEELITELWHDGLISGEMHLGTGEEAIVAGVLAHVKEGDALALDHRATPPLIMRGVDPVAILRELLGRSGGLCGGQGGHMHLFSRQHLAASSGIVGASGPAAAGFALAAQYLRRGTVSVAFFGEGAMNQGMLLESINLAAVWRLPVLFVCKDDEWAITSDSSRLLGGSLSERVQGLGVPYVEVDGLNVASVWDVAQQAIQDARRGSGPAFLHAHCTHLEAHFLGYPLLRALRDPWRELPTVAGPLVRSVLRWRGTSPRERLRSMGFVFASLVATLSDRRRAPANDPLERTRLLLMSDPQRLAALDRDIEEEVEAILATALGEPIP